LELNTALVTNSKLRPAVKREQLGRTKYTIMCVQCSVPHIKKWVQIANKIQDPTGQIRLERLSALSHIDSGTHQSVTGT